MTVRAADGDGTVASGTYYVGGDVGGVDDGRNVETWTVGSRYELTRLVGTGSFGSVCEARDAANDGVKCAMKRIPNALASESDARKVLREIVALRRTNHPNVCTLRHAFFSESACGARKLDVATMKLRAVSIDVYLSFEYAEGGDIYALRGQLSEKEVRGLILQAVEATRYLHSVGIWHRDIKSANTLLGRHRHGGRIIKLCDFGSARGGAEWGFGARIGGVCERNKATAHGGVDVESR
jgi:mitogen-activated protein kinase 1/3